MVIQDNIQMVDLKGQYLKIKEEIDRAVLDCIGSTQYINGPIVKAFQQDLEAHLNVKHVIPCANGTDALQVSLMALDLKPGDEVIVPSFTYVATAEVIALLLLKPVMVDVDPETFNITPEILEAAITSKTKAVVPVHLFGQSTDMEPIMAVAKKHGIFVIEDTAQAINADYQFEDGRIEKAGTIGDVGTTSFFPSKNLGCYGDGGAIFTNNDELAKNIRMIANHGQTRRYFHGVIGVNSRLDAIQAAILKVKLQYLNDYCAARQEVAATYDAAFKEIVQLQIPARQHNSTHVFHQYTLIVKDGQRDALKAYLADKGIPSNIYYPVPLYKQEAYLPFYDGEELPVTEKLCDSVLSLPIHTEMEQDLLDFICQSLISFFKQN